MRQSFLRSALLLVYICVLTSIANAQPIVTVNQAAGQSDPTTSVPVKFTVVFDQDVTGFDASDISFAGSTVTGALVAAVTGTGSTYEVSVTGITGGGNVVASVNAGAAQNISGQTSLASTSTDNVVGVVVTPHDLSIVKYGPTIAEAGSTFTYNIIVSNNSSSTILNVTVLDQLPAGILFMSESVIVGPGLIGLPNVTSPPLGQNGLVSISLFGLAPGGQVYCFITVTLAPNLTGSISNTATVIGPLGDLIPENNSSTATTEVIPLQAPTITCPADFTVGAGAPLCSPSIDFANDHPAIVTGTPTPTVSYSIKNDNTQAIVTTSTSTSLPIGEYTVTATATNSVGTASCSFKISVIAGTFPISCPEDYTIETIDPQCVAYILLTSGEHAVDYYFPPNLSFTWADDKGNTGSAAGVFVAPPGIYTITAKAVECGVQTNSCSYVVTVVPKTVMITCPGNISLVDENNDCKEEITLSGSYAVATRNTINTIYKWVDANGNSGSVSTGPFGGAPPPFTFPVGVNTIKVIANGCGDAKDSCTFTVTVTESEPPVITRCASDITVSCAADIPVADISEIIATDNCGTPVISHVGDVISEQTCANKFKLTRTYRATDVSGNTATCSQTITVDDKTPPTLTGLTASKNVLAPPNHKMVDLTLAYTIYDNCISTPDVTINITSNEPVNGTGDGDTDPDWEIIDDHHIRLRAERAGNGTGRIYTITVTVNDGCNAPVSATTEVRVTHNITGPHSGNSFKVGSTVTFTGEFWDVPGNTHTAKWLIDGSAIAKATIIEAAGNKNGKVNGSYKFTTPGVYKLQMNVTDQKGLTTYANTNGDLEAIVVIYDPNGGHTYGGGYFNSPAGALLSNPSSTGKASYGFAMNYFKNSTNPKGETQFEFKVGDFEFNALNFDYLVISNSMAQFKGTGKIIGGQSGVGFTMTVTDGQLDGSGLDKIRMKIYNKNTGKVLYDNQPGASDAALPTQAVGANSTIVIGGSNNSILTKSTSTQNVEMEAATVKAKVGLEVVAYPNPTTNHFSITVQANAKEKIMMQVVDMYGRVVETRNVPANSIVRFGDRYATGTYFVRIMQGKEHKEIKLVKLSD